MRALKDSTKVHVYNVGFLTHVLRIGPHFCLTFVYLGMLKRHLLGVYEYMDQRELFARFDLDGDGKLNKTELEQTIRNCIPSAQNNVSQTKVGRSIYREDIKSY